MRRFDYVRYDDHSNLIQAGFKEQVENLESAIEERIADPRAKELALTNLEQVYMWIGKGIKNDQLGRNPATPSEERRG